MAPPTYGDLGKSSRDVFGNGHYYFSGSLIKLYVKTKTTSGVNSYNGKVIQGQVHKGLKLTFDCTFSPKTSAKIGTIKARYKHDLVTLNSDVDINLSGPLVNASAVIRHQGWLAGYQAKFDTTKSKLTWDTPVVTLSCTPTSMMDNFLVAQFTKRSTSSW